MKDNIYIKSLKLGFESDDGITLREILDKVGIDLDKDVTFKRTYIIWYSNNFETYERVDWRNDISFEGEGLEHTTRRLMDFKTFIKGDAVSKYIDYIELSDARKANNAARRSSATAQKYAFISICIALASLLSSIILPIIFEDDTKPQIEIVEDKKEDSPQCKESIDSDNLKVNEKNTRSSQAQINNELYEDKTKDDSLQNRIK